MNETRSHQRHDAQQGTAGQADDGRRPGGRPDVFGEVKRSSTRSWLLLQSRLSGLGQQRGVVANAKSGGNNEPCSGSRGLRHNADHQSRQLLGAERWSAMPSVGGWSTSASDCLWRRRSKNFASSPRLIAVRGSRDGCSGARGRASAMGIWGGSTGKPNSTGFAIWSRAQLPIPPTSNGRPSLNSQGVRAVAGISRQPHAYPLARQTRRAMPGWAALQGAGQQHGRSVHGVDRIAHRRAGVGAAAVSLGVQRDRSRKHGVGTAGVATRRLCRGGEVSECRLGASLATSAEHGGHEQP